jgi:predicted DNA-binding WGR domain protein
MNDRTRTFDYADDKSSKFWEIRQCGNTVTVRYGKTGTNGQTQEKGFVDAVAADKHVAKLITEKTGKGYIERGMVTPTLKTVITVASASSPVAGATPKKTLDKSTKVLKFAKDKNPLQDPEASPESLLALFNKDDTTNRKLAKHPRASAELLEKLSHCSDAATRRNVASNPNTPPETFIKLGQQYPKEFLANPALDLLLMIQPTLMEEVPQALLIRLLKQDDCPSSLLTWAASHTQAKVQLAVAMNAKAPEHALAKLRSSQHASVLEAVKASTSSVNDLLDPDKAFEQAVRDRLASMTSQELYEAWSEGDIGLAQWSSLPLSFRVDKASALSFGPEHVARILRDTTWTLEKLKKALSNYKYWDQVATDLATPSHVLEQLFKEPDSSIRRSVARNSATPIRVLEAAALDPDAELRADVAGNASTPLPVLIALSRDTHFEIRSNVASNSSVPVSVLEYLAQDTDVGVRVSVIGNKLAPLSVIKAFFDDPDAWIRSKVAQNPATPVDVLELLAKDSDDHVRQSVAGNSCLPVSLRDALLEPLVRKLDKFHLRRIARDPGTIPSILKTLSQELDSEVRWSVAENKSTDVDVLVALAKDSDISVRQSVAKNPSTPAAVLVALAKESDSLLWIRSSVAENASTPAPVLAELAQNSNDSVRVAVAKNHSTPTSSLVDLAEDAQSTVRAAVASNLTTKPELLAEMASDRNVEVLIAVAHNPNAPISALLQLVKSKSVNVRCAVASQAHRNEKICSILSNDGIPPNQ